MTILHSCCFWKSVRNGSFASAIYTMIYFGSSCLIASINVHDEQKYLTGKTDKPKGESFLEKEAISPTTVVFNILLLISSSIGLFSSFLVIVALKLDQRQLLLPWILVLLVDLFLELAHFMYLLIMDTLDFDPITGILFTCDFFIMCLNIYCLLCVISQYQEYKAGRGCVRKQSRGETAKKHNPPPPPPTMTCLSTFRHNQHHQTSTSPLIYGHTNFSMIPEEPTQAENQDSDEIEQMPTENAEQSTKQQQNEQQHEHTNIKKKHVQFPDEFHDNGDDNSDASDNNDDNNKSLQQLNNNNNNAFTQTSRIRNGLIVTTDPNSSDIKVSITKPRETDYNEIVISTWQDNNLPDQQNYCQNVIDI